MIYRTFLLLATTALLFSCKVKPIENIDPQEAIVITDMTQDKMAHCSIFKIIGDTVYFAYYHDTVQVKEHPMFSSIVPVFAKAKFPLDGNIERVEVIRCGETLGDFTQDMTRAPYDPNMLKVGNKLMYYFNGCMDGTVCYCVRPYNLETATFEDAVQKCTVSYNGKTWPLDSYSLFTIMEQMGHKDLKFNNDVVMSHRFIERDGAYYNVMCNGFSHRSFPILLKTSDGINYEVVFAFNENPGGACEAAFEFIGDDVYLITRDHFAEWRKSGMFISKYSFRDGSCLVAPRLLTNQPAKPALILRGKNLYALYNVFPDIERDGKRIDRSRLRMARVGEDCSLVDSLDVIGNYGIHYPYTDYIGDDIYMTFTEDRREISEATRSNISMIRLGL